MILLPTRVILILRPAAQIPARLNPMSSVTGVPDHEEEKIENHVRDIKHLRTHTEKLQRDGSEKHGQISVMDSQTHL